MEVVNGYRLTQMDLRKSREGAVAQVWDRHVEGTLGAGVEEEETEGKNGGVQEQDSMISQMHDIASGGRSQLYDKYCSGYEPVLL